MMAERRDKDAGRAARTEDRGARGDLENNAVDFHVEHVWKDEVSTASQIPKTRTMTNECGIVPMVSRKQTVGNKCNRETQIKILLLKKNYGSLNRELSRETGKMGWRVNGNSVGKD
jgi:hypothetical protein